MRACGSTRGIACAVLWLLWAGMAWGQQEMPPPPGGATLELRAVLNRDTKPLALLAVDDPKTRAQLLQVLDVLLEQTSEVTLWRYGLAQPGPVSMEAGLAFYGDWARSHGLRSAGQYVARDADGSTGESVVTGRGELYLATGEGGGLLAVYAELDSISLLWAQGDLHLGPLLAPLLGLPPLKGAIPEGPQPVEPDLPLLPQGLPMDLMIARLDLTSVDILPLAREIAAMVESGMGEGEIPGDAYLLMRQGPAALAGVQGLTVIAFETPRPVQAQRVLDAALSYAAAREWTSLYRMTKGGVEVELYAKLGDVGGILIVGKRDDMTALLLTKGAPDLLALLVGIS